MATHTNLDWQAFEKLQAENPTVKFRYKSGSLRLGTAVFESERPKSVEAFRASQDRPGDRLGAFRVNCDIDGRTLDPGHPDAPAEEVADMLRVMGRNERERRERRRLELAWLGKLSREDRRRLDSGQLQVPDFVV